MISVFGFSLGASLPSGPYGAQPRRSPPVDAFRRRFVWPRAVLLALAVGGCGRGVGLRCSMGEATVEAGKTVVIADAPGCPTEICLRPVAMLGSSTSPVEGHPHCSATCETDSDCESEDGYDCQSFRCVIATDSGPLACQKLCVCNEFASSTSPVTQVCADRDCAKAAECASAGACHSVGGQCRPGSDAECGLAPECASAGACHFLGGQCRPGSNAECAKDVACQRRGGCSFEHGFCRPKQNPPGYVFVGPGNFTMGSPPGESIRDNDEVSHMVTLTRGFWLKSTEVTQIEWISVMGTSPSHFNSCGDTCPVEEVSWDDATAYCDALSKKEGLTACYEAGTFKGVDCEGYRLPTEAEWEYAARAGATGARYGDLDAIAWYDDNSGTTTHPVGQKQPNAWGLSDMLGNVWEWCQDWYGDYSGDATDPVGPQSGSNRVIRGGGWHAVATGVGAAVRYWLAPAQRNGFLGFRPARTLPTKAGSGPSSP